MAGTSHAVSTLVCPGATKTMSSGPSPMVWYATWRSPDRAYCVGRRSIIRSTRSLAAATQATHREAACNELAGQSGQVGTHPEPGSSSRPSPEKPHPATVRIRVTTRMLLNAGADVVARDQCGKTPLSGALLNSQDGPKSRADSSRVAALMPPVSG